MKKKAFFLCAAVLLLSVSFMASAQSEDLEPGIYAVVDGDYSVLAHTMGITGNSGTSVFGIDVGQSKISYKGDKSETKATGTFVMVINPEKKAITQTPKKYDPFIKSMTPDNMIIVPLVVEKNKRIYDKGVSLNGINTKKKAHVSFEWEQTGDNAFTITTEELVPGEYAIAFKPAKLGEFNFSCIFGFFVEEQ